MKEREEEENEDDDDENSINIMGWDSKKKPTRDGRRLLACFDQGKVAAAAAVDHDNIIDHQMMKFSQDNDRDDHGFASNFDGFDYDNDDDDDDTAGNEPTKRTVYWETQEFLLQEILDQCNSSGSKLRAQIKRNIERARGSKFCNCMDNNQRGCTKCLRQAAVDQLCSKGFNAALCTSKWNKTHKIPGGTHEYIQVTAFTQGKRKQIPFLVELGFQDEFRMAKACSEYNKLIDQLPEIYTGKIEHLNAIISVVCEAAKKSAKEQKVHMGPWRKRSFMQMKWSASGEKKSVDYSSNELWVSTSTQENMNAVRTSFQIPMASAVTVKVG